MRPVPPLAPRREPAARQQIIVPGVSVADAGNDGEVDGLGIEFFRHFGAADPPRIFSAGVFGDPSCFARGASGVAFGDVAAEFRNIGLVELGATGCGYGPPLFSPLGVRLALRLGSLERLLLDKRSLPFVTLARPSPLHDHGPEAGVFAGATGQSRIAAGKEDEVVEVGALEALGLVVDLSDPRAPSELFIAKIALLRSAP